MSNSSNRLSRVLSLRDKRHTKTHDVHTNFHGLFTLPHNTKKPNKDEEKKIQELASQLSSLGHNTVPEARVQYVVRAKSVDGDTKRAFQLLMLFEDSVGGILKPYDPSVSLLGAENREKVTCYLDSLLFAMFVKVDVFEAILFNDFDDEPRKRLVTVLRLWVNLLRTGRLITTDITQHLQEALAECGWPEAARLRQQDASEAFTFITDKLDLPLLTLKTDLFHAGKEDADDDHKFVTERLLDVAIPDDVQNGVVTLEKCLEEYFNNRVEVKRELQRRTTVQSLSDYKEPEDKGKAVHIEAAEVESGMTSPAVETPSDVAYKRPLLWDQRKPSIFSERKVEIPHSTPEEVSSTATGRPTGRPRKSSVRKEILMPAWQFLNLIPWYTDSAKNNVTRMATHFSSQRPMLGICLKRYVMSKTGSASRLSIHVDIPLEMTPPHFVPDDQIQDDSFTSNFKLSLQSVICHRGVSVNAGHYIALVRIGDTGPDKNGTFPEADVNRAQKPRHDDWLIFDDLASQRVKTVDINKALHDECPYLLFYRVCPLRDDDDVQEALPPYAESKESFTSVDQKLASLSNKSQTSLEALEARSSRPSFAISEEETKPSSLTTTEGIVASPVVKTEEPEVIQDAKADEPGVAPTLNKEHTPTEPTASSEEIKNPQMSSSLRPQSRTRSTANRHSMEVTATDRRLISRITSRLSRDRLAESVVVLDNSGYERDGPFGRAKSITLDTSNPPSQNQSDISVNQKQHLPSKEVPLHATTVPIAPATKGKEKKSRLRGRSRRGSGGNSKDADRECIVM